MGEKGGRKQFKASVGLMQKRSRYATQKSCAKKLGDFSIYPQSRWSVKLKEGFNRKPRIAKGSKGVELNLLVLTSTKKEQRSQGSFPQGRQA